MPVELAATYCAGLREGSRIVKKMSGVQTSVTNALLALLIDDVKRLSYAICGMKEKPLSIYELLTGTNKEKEELGFDSPEEFEEVKNKLIERVSNNGR